MSESLGPTRSVATAMWQPNALWRLLTDAPNDLKEYFHATLHIQCKDEGTHLLTLRMVCKLCASQVTWLPLNKKVELTQKQLWVLRLAQVHVANVAIVPNKMKKNMAPLHELRDADVLYSEGLPARGVTRTRRGLIKKTGRLSINVSNTSQLYDPDGEGGPRGGRYCAPGIALCDFSGNVGGDVNIGFTWCCACVGVRSVTYDGSGMRRKFPDSIKPLRKEYETALFNFLHMMLYRHEVFSNLQHLDLHWVTMVPPNELDFRRLTQLKSLVLHRILWCDNYGRIGIEWHPVHSGPASGSVGVYDLSERVRPQSLKQLALTACSNTIKLLNANVFQGLTKLCLRSKSCEFGNHVLGHSLKNLKPIANTLQMLDVRGWDAGYLDGLQHFDKLTFLDISMVVHASYKSMDTVVQQIMELLFTSERIDLGLPFICYHLQTPLHLASNEIYKTLPYLLGENNYHYYYGPEGLQCESSSDPMLEDICDNWDKTFPGGEGPTRASLHQLVPS